MKRFSEKDVRRCYDLLQHDPESGLTQLKAMDNDGIIGIGLFDNEDDFTAECARYNTFGGLFVGVNPRPLSLLDEFGGLKNRVRSMFVDVAEGAPIKHITGVAVPPEVPVSKLADPFVRETSILHDGEMFFAFGAPVPAKQASRVQNWLTESDSWPYNVSQYVPVPGTAQPQGGLLSRRVTFRRYRPYVLSEVSDAILAAEIERSIDSP